MANTVIGLSYCDLGGWPALWAGKLLPPGMKKRRIVAAKAAVDRPKVI
jgi:hypothetical protein